MTEIAPTPEPPVKELLAAWQTVGSLLTPLDVTDNFDVVDRVWREVPNLLVLLLQRAQEIADLKLIADVVAGALKDYGGDLTKEACDACEQCGPLVMCSFHSLLSVLARHVPTVYQLEVEGRLKHAEAQLTARAQEIEQVKAERAWQPIETPPDWPHSHSLRLLGVLADGHHVFCQYTPFYLGHPDEAKGLWTCEGFAWATKPTHWMPLPDPTDAALVSRTPQPEQDDYAEAKRYLTALFARVAPQCEPLPTLSGLATQIDNYIAGLRAAPLPASAALQDLIASWRIPSTAYYVGSGNPENVEAWQAALRYCADELAAVLSRTDQP